MGIITFLSDIMKVMLDFFYQVTTSYGISVILLTLTIKLLLFPLTLKQSASMQKMKVVQPKLKELQKKYKGKPEVYQKRMMELYRQHKVNPLAGCLPAILQIIFIIPLFRLLQDPEVFSEGPSAFLWLGGGLENPDPLFILPVLAGILTYVQMAVSSADATQQKMMFFMPAFIIFISRSFPAGVVLYWVISNIFMIGQQLWIKKNMEGQKEDKKKEDKK